MAEDLKKKQNDEQLDEVNGGKQVIPPECVIEDE